MIAFSLDNLLFFLLIAVAALFQLLSKTISKARKSDSNETSISPEPQTPRPVQRAPRESDADRIRKFLEALGQPPTSSPPPPVVPRTDIPPRRVASVQPPTVIPRPWGLIREQKTRPDITRRESPSPEQPGGVAQTFPSAVPAAVPFEVHKASLSLEPEQPPVVSKTPVEAYAAPKAFGVAREIYFKADLSTVLASKSRLREAIILREIFGPPRGLQAEEIGT